MPPDRVFMVAVDVTDPAFKADHVRKVLKTTPSITGWWNHIPGCFLISTTLDEDGLTDKLREATGETSILVVEANPAASEGWLPTSSWAWIKKRAKELDRA